jgi:DNA-binding NarL/FixJ family response regulator
MLRAGRASLDEPTVAARFREEPQRPYPAGPTEREVQLLRLLASDRSNKEIAAWSVLSPPAVTHHASNMSHMAGVAHRAEAGPAGGSPHRTQHEQRGASFARRALV